MNGATLRSSTSGQLCTKLRFGKIVAADGMNPLRPIKDCRPSSVHIALVDSMTLGSDRKSTRLNSSHSQISYAVFCLKKKKADHAGPLRALSRRTDDRSQPSPTPKHPRCRL